MARNYHHDDETPTVELKDIAERMKAIDICAMTTVTEGGGLASRPMSNNGDVTYDGNSWFYTHEDTRLVADLKKNPHTALAFEGMDGVHIAVSGAAKITQDKAMIREHWVPELDQWFEQGVDTPGVTLVQIVADHVKFWDGEESGEWRS